MIEKSRMFEVAMKNMLSVDEQIAHMKRKGITFNVMSEDQAKTFLANNNYFFKLSSYRENYVKCDTGKREGQYTKLDFAYLRELSTLDMHLRYLLVEMCLDIEHAIKVRLLDKVEKNPREDGYEIARRFLAKETGFRTLKKIQSHKSGEYCKDLIEKYYPYFPVWVLVEIISFSELLYLCSTYAEVYGDEIVNNKLMNTVRDIRNASAHSNCLMNHMTEKLDETKQPDCVITQFVKGIPGISDSSRRNNLSCSFVYNMVTLLFVYDSLVTIETKKKRYAKLKTFMDERVSRNKDYFKSNTKLVSIYKFLKKVVDNLHDGAYNTTTIEK